MALSPNNPAVHAASGICHAVTPIFNEAIFTVSVVPERSSSSNIYIFITQSLAFPCQSSVICSGLDSSDLEPFGWR
jgi:hypothetical protein